MMWKALGWIREGQAGLKPAFAKTWSKALVSWRLTDTVRMEFSQSVFDFIWRNLRGSDGFFEQRCLWEICCLVLG